MGISTSDYLNMQARVSRGKPVTSTPTAVKRERDFHERIVETAFIPNLSEDERKLNKTEKDYLFYLRSLGDVWIGVQNITLKLAHDCRFTPDFSAINNKGEMRMIDVKGFQREDALIKIKVAARQFPWIRFIIVKKENGGWNHVEVAI